MNRARPRADWTVTVLRAGSFSAAVLLTLGFAVTLLALGDAGRIVSLAGVLILLATPPLALVATFLELRAVQPRAAWLALVVLVTLAIAAVVAALYG
jgi:hypothetical protein